MQSNKNLKTKNYLIIILLVIIILYGFLLRIFDLGLTSFWIDEATSAVSGMQILKFGLPIFESGVFYQASIIHSYLIAVSMLIFGISEFSARFPATIIGSFLILLSFILGKNIKDSKTGLIFAFFMSISYFEILWSRQARFYILLQAGYLICLILFLNYTKKELNLKSIGILLLFTLLTILSNLLGAVLIFIYTIYIIYLLKIKKFKISKTVILYINKHKKYLILVLVLLAVILSIYFNLLKIIGILVTESLKNISVGYYIDFITSHFSYTLILMIIGLIYLYTKSKETFVFILINLVLPVVIISLIIPTPYMRYVFTFTFPLIFLLISIGITYSIEKLITQLNNNLIKNKNLIQSITNLGILILIIFILIFSSNLTSLTPQIYSQNNQNTLFTIYPQSFYKLPRNVPLIDFKTAYKNTIDLIDYNTKIITVTTGSSPTYFYLRDIYSQKNNYVFDYDPTNKNTGDLGWAIFSSDENLFKDQYGNATLIRTHEEFMDLINSSEKIIVFIDQSKWSHIDQKTTNFIKDKMYLYTPASNETITTYIYTKNTKVNTFNEINLNQFNTETTFGIDISNKIDFPEYVIYPKIDNNLSYANYIIGFDLNNTKSISIEVEGRRRDEKHQLFISLFKNESYEKIIDFDYPLTRINKTIIVNPNDLNTNILDLRINFYRDSNGENYPRVFKIKISFLQ